MRAASEVRTAVRQILTVAVLTAMVSAATGWSQTPTPPADKPPMSEKQKQLLEQTNALLQLAAELKVSVDKSNKDQLSLDVVRKAEAVEKMARELKARMK